MRGYRIRATSMNLIGGRNERPGGDASESRPKPEPVSLGNPEVNKTNAFPPLMTEGDDLPF